MWVSDSVTRRIDDGDRARLLRAVEAMPFPTFLVVAPFLSAADVVSDEDRLALLRDGLGKDGLYIVSDDRGTSVDATAFGVQLPMRAHDITQAAYWDFDRDDPALPKLEYILALARGEPRMPRAERAAIPPSEGGPMPTPYPRGDEESSSAGFGFAILGDVPVRHRAVGHRAGAPSPAPALARPPPRRVAARGQHARARGQRPLQAGAGDRAQARARRSRAGPRGRGVDGARPQGQADRRPRRARARRARPRGAQGQRARALLLRSAPPGLGEAHALDDGPRDDRGAGVQASARRRSRPTRCRTRCGTATARTGSARPCGRARASGRCGATCAARSRRTAGEGRALHAADGAPVRRARRRRGSARPCGEGPGGVAAVRPPGAAVPHPGARPAADRAAPARGQRARST